MPPDSPNTARRKPVRSISLRMKRVRISVTSGGWIARSAAAESRFITPPLDPIEFFDGHQELFVAAERRDQPLAAQFGQIAIDQRQALIELRRLRNELPIGPDD